jgi:putative redox protein
MQPRWRGDSSESLSPLRNGCIFLTEGQVMELTVTYLGGVQFEAEARGHKIYSDQPSSNNGFDEGMTPPELLLASVGTCAGYYAAEYLNRMQLPSAGLRIRVNAEKATNPARLSKFIIVVEAPGVEDPEHMEGVKRAVGKCLVKNTLAMPPEISIEVESLHPAHV